MLAMVPYKHLRSKTYNLTKEGTNAHILDSNRRHLRKAYHEECQQIGDESCVAQVRTITVKNQHNKEAGQQRLGINPRIVTLNDDAGSWKEKDLTGLLKNKSEKGQGFNGGTTS